MSLVDLLVVLVVICLIFWAFKTLTATFEVDPRVRMVMLVLLVVAVCLWLLGAVTGRGPEIRLY